MKGQTFAPREFLANYQLPQLVCIHEAHLQQVNESRPRQKSRNRLSASSHVNSPTSDGKNKSDKQQSPKSILSSLTTSAQQLSKHCLKKIEQKTDRTPNTLSSHTPSKVNFNPNHRIKSIRVNSDEECKDDETVEEVFSEELALDEDYRTHFKTNTLASSDSGNASAASNCSENQYRSNLSPEQNNKCTINQVNNQTNNNAIESVSIADDHRALPVQRINTEQATDNSVKSEKKLLDLDQPFLLYKSYSSRQVIAHILDVSAAAQESPDHFQRTGPSLLIPESYSGWFALVTSTGQTAGYFTSIDELACSQVPYFMSRDSIWAIPAPSNVTNHSVLGGEGGQLAENEQQSSGQSIVELSNTNQSYSKSIKKVFLPAGTSFRFLGLYEDVSTLLNNAGKKSRFSTAATRKTNQSAEEAIRTRFLLGSNNSDKQSPRFLKCLALAGDQLLANQMVFMPTTQTGRFYVICKKKTEKNSNQLSYNHVYKLSQLLKLIKLPATVQLVVGQRPREYNAQCKMGKENRIKEWYFSAVLKLEQFKIRDVILAATIRSQPFRLDTERKSSKTVVNRPEDLQRTKQRAQSFASSIRESLLNHSIRKISKKRKSILEQATKTAGLGNLIEEDGALSTENGDLAILLEFDLDSNLQFIPYRSELNNLVSNHLNGLNRSLLSSVSPHASSLSSHPLHFKQANKLISFKSQLHDQKLPELLLQRIVFCNEHSDQWRQQIKLAHEIIPKPPPFRLRSGEHVSNTDRTHHLKNNNNTKRACLCENCQIKRVNAVNQLNGSKEQSIDCRMPSMDNVLLRANEFHTNLSNDSPASQQASSNSKITQIFNRLCFNSIVNISNNKEPQSMNGKQTIRLSSSSPTATVDRNRTISVVSNNSNSTRANSGATSLPTVISACSQLAATTQSCRNHQVSNATTARKIQSTPNQSSDERKSRLQSKNSIRLINGSLGTLKNHRITDQSHSVCSAQHGLMNNYLINGEDCNQDTNSLLYKRMLSYSTQSLEPNGKQYHQASQAAQENGTFINQKTADNYLFNSALDNMIIDSVTHDMANSASTKMRDKSSLRMKSDQENQLQDENRNEMMRLLGKHSDSCSERCCEVKASQLPKIKINQNLNMMQASLGYNRGARFLRKPSSVFSKSLNSLANLHLYETLESINASKLQHRMSRKRTLNTIFPQINLKSNQPSRVNESNDDQLNNDLEDLSDEVDLNDFDLDDELLNDEDENLDDEIEFKFNLNPESFDFTDYNLKMSDLHDKQRTTKIVLKKQPKIRQRQQPAKLIKNSIIKNQFTDQAGLLVKKNSFLSNYGSESSDESPAK